MKSPNTRNGPRLKARAERQQGTQRRIAAAAASLHEEVGPARTTIAEVARRAGVQRLTVYNHFPTERDLYAACQGHFLAEHPPPDPLPALALTEPAERVRSALEPMYRWYRSTEAMTGNVHRDRRLLPELDALLTVTVDREFEALAQELARGFGRRGRARTHTRALIRLALEFSTWQRLARAALSDAEAAGLMAQTARAAGGQPTAGPP